MRVDRRFAGLHPDCHLASGLSVAGLAEDRLLALFGYGASAWHLAPRDRWIGWNDAQRQAGLPHVVGQVRFLILPWIGCPHLASKLLLLSAARLPADWEQRRRNSLLAGGKFCRPQSL